MTPDWLVWWLESWYGVATFLWLIASLWFGRLYITALMKDGFKPFIIKAITTAIIGTVESGFYFLIIVTQTENLVLRRIAAAALPVGITLQAVVYIVVGLWIVRDVPESRDT